MPYHKKNSFFAVVGVHCHATVKYKRKGKRLAVSSHDKGQKAESLVVSYLQKKGWSIVARNYRALGAEIDIIAIENNELVFIEVKSGNRQSEYLAESVTMAKQKRIVRAASEFRYRRRMQDYPVRFEVITVTMPQAAIRHFQEEFFEW